MSKEFQEAKNALQGRMEQLLTAAAFDELLSMAEEVCLSYPYERAAPPAAAENDEAMIISQLGTRGLKAALELGLNIIPSDMAVNTEEVESEKQRPMLLDTPFRLPKSFSNEIDFSVLAKAESFGNALINESFSILGQDAFAQLELFKQAKTIEQQLKVVAWLDERLDSLNTLARQPEEATNTNDSHLYHPIRLSPKVVGSYPNHTLPPTCLGMSIIATSFFKRAGVDVLHAGVEQSFFDNSDIAAVDFVRSLKQIITDRYNLSIPDPVQSAIDAIEVRFSDRLTRNDAHHAAVYVRLLDGSWLQMDPNYHATVHIDRDVINNKLDLDFNILSELRSISPGLQLAEYLSPYITIADSSHEVATSHIPNIVDTLRQITESVLPGLIDDESIPQKIYEECILPFFTISGGDERLAELQRVLRVDVAEAEWDEFESPLQVAFYKAFEKFVLWGDDVNSFLERLRIDPAYYKDRIEDIVLLPFLMMVSMTGSEADGPPLFTSHAAVELGSAEMRIGLAVLSDFATYTDAPLPASFWLSHWASDVPTFEYLDGASHSDREDSLVRNNVIYHNNHPLTSYKNGGIIKEFLSLRRENMEDAQD